MTESRVFAVQQPTCLKMWRFAPILALAGSCQQPETPPPASFQFTALVASVGHMCGLTTAGTAYCWGSNESGELGDGTRTTRLRPVAVTGGLQFSGLAAGGGTLEGYALGNRTCALTTAGATYCWGGGFGNAAGVPSERTAPVAMTGFSFQMVTVGSTHACGLSASGQVLCWGGDNFGQLGDDALTNRATPAPVSGGLLFRSIVAGGAHTCGLTATGAAYCWGYGGARGDGSLLQHQSPPTPVAGGLTFRSLVAGGGEVFEEHTCGLTADGSAYCWGFNGFGELGDGTRTLRSAPVAVATSLKFASLTASQDHTCGITLAGDAYCWGDGYTGQLGNGAVASSTTPIVVATTLRFRSLTAGVNYTCGIDVNGRAFCWGGNGGRFGDGTTTSHLSPVAVSPP